MDHDYGEVADPWLSESSLLRMAERGVSFETQNVSNQEINEAAVLWGVSHEFFSYRSRHLSLRAGLRYIRTWISV